MNSEQEMRLQFLDEAGEYIDTIEAGVLMISPFESQKWDTVLRAAHSIKGGAAMMGYHPLGEIAHRLEDFLKIIKANRGQSLNTVVETELLQGVDCLRRGVIICRQGDAIDSDWLDENINPILGRLRDELGDLSAIDEINLLADEAGEDMVVFLFQTEVDSCLQRLEELLANPENICLREEFQIVAQELGGLGEMLELPNFSQLCAAIDQQLTITNDEDLRTNAGQALRLWKRSQALVLIGQREAMPTSFEELAVNFANDEPDIPQFSTAEMPPLEAFALDELTFLDDLPDFDNDRLSFAEKSTETTILDLQPIFAQTLEIDPLDTHTTLTEDTPQAIRVPTRQLDGLGDMVGELTIDRNGLNLQLSSLRSLVALLNQRVSILGQTNQTLRTLYDRDQLGIPAGSWGMRGILPQLPNSLALTGGNIPFSDRLEMDQYSDHHLIFQELMETIVQIQEVTSDIDTDLDGTLRTARQLTRTSQLLQTQLTQVRMRPFSDLVGRFPRTVRDMSLKYGKSVDLVISGGDILIDRTILDVLGDPLLHLVRNAFDHGIEDPETRIALGKPPEGRITISATYQGNQTIITLRDDGSGLDVDKISAKAMQMGLTADDLQKLSQQDLLNFIFEPGFSTAEEVTDLSGRGVGLDIVRETVARVRGQIQIETQNGQGTTFTIAVPVNLSISRVLLAESGGLLMAFPISAIEEMLIPTPDQRFVRAGQKFLNWDDDEPIPLFSLRSGLPISRPFTKPETNLSPIINQPVVLIVARGEELVGLEVDAYYGEQEVTLRAIEGFFPLPSGFSRCTILGDGRVVPLVDTYELIHFLKGNQMTTPSSFTTFSHSPQDLLAENAPPMVMVVDDSINVRRFLALTLEKAGYRVQQAKDGQEALEKLQEGLPIQAVVCDVEMPRLDGYGFLAQVRSIPLYRKLPILMLTSRSGDKHRQIAFNLGASAYFAKPFQEQELLQTLKTLMRPKVTV